MFTKKFSIATAIAIFLTSFASQTTSAATFTTQEINEIHNFQKEYAALDKKTNYDNSNIYAKKPHLSKKFNARSLNSKYISNAD